MSDGPKIMTDEELDAELKRDRWPGWVPLFDNERRRQAREDYADNWERTFGKPKEEKKSEDWDGDTGDIG